MCIAGSLLFQVFFAKNEEKWTWSTVIVYSSVFCTQKNNVTTHILHSEVMTVLLALTALQLVGGSTLTGDIAVGHQ